ncbi:MAG TPA: hypothetical protein VF950_03330 [Planctomycetota bacterium]
MPKASSARLMALFVAVSVGTSLAATFVQRMTIAFGRGSTTGAFAAFLIILFMSSLAVGWLQSRILTLHRAPLRRWTLATVLGSLAGGILGYLTSREVFGMVGPAGRSLAGTWLTTLSWVVSSAACIGAAQALAIWGRRWTSETFLWLTGLLLVRLLAGALPLLFRGTMEPGRSIPYLSLFVVPLLSAAVAGAGTAWMLDRLVFRAPADPPSEEKSSGWISP